MNLEKWWPWYYEMVEAFNFDMEKDRASTRLLSRILKGRSMSLKELRRSLRDRSFIVFGCGPSLESDLKKALNAKLFSRYFPVAADGSAHALFKVALTSPYAVVTDLDGSIRGLLKADGKGAITVIHAHGDNLEALRRYVPMFKGRITGSTQTEPLEGVHNFGGFTDGDRAVFLLEEMEARRVILMGMDFGSKVGRYSKPRMRRDRVADQLKLMKLEYAKRLLEWMAPGASCEILNATGSGEPLKGIPKISLESL